MCVCLCFHSLWCVCVCVCACSAKIHVTLDHYKQKKTDEELYSAVNFIIQDQGVLTRVHCHMDYLCVSMFLTCVCFSVGAQEPVSNGSKGRQRSQLSESSDPPILTTKYRKDSINSRPMLPIPRSTSGTSSQRTAVTTPSEGPNGFTNPPPIPRRR